MSGRYAALSSDPRAGEDEVDELEAAFEGSDDEDEAEFHDAHSEYRPLNPEDTSTPSLSYPLRGQNGDDGPDSGANMRPLHSRSHSIVAPSSNATNGVGAYDFENVNDYDYAYRPPPGSPPRADRALLNNTWGNSNGIIPDFSSVSLPARRRGWEWMQRVLPERFRSRESTAGRAIGGGMENDGVFANVMAKPSVPVQVTDGENGVYIMPEDAQKDAPPSYASAQADAVPPYWETTVHAPSSLSPGNMVPGDLPIDGLATGTLFSFLWNMLVSISFQFVGFLLTYLMHTTHAAKLGARAGLGLTLVQYGFALRNGEDNGSGGIGYETDAGASPTPPIFSSAAEAEEWFESHPNATMLPGGGIDMGGATYNNTSSLNDVTTEWLAFLLMTIGWFILLNSLLGFWRIKRWERSILASHQSPSSSDATANNTSTSSTATTPNSYIERTFGLRFPSGSMFRQGLGFSHGEYPGAAAQQSGGGLLDGLDGLDRFGHRQDPADLEANPRNSSLDENGVRVDELRSLFPHIPPDHPDRPRMIAEAYANERRLQEDLRAAGLL